MKALSLTPLWAHVVVHQGKRIENRTKWRDCHYRGPLLIHASKSVEKGAERAAIVDRCFANGVPREWFDGHEFSTGGIIGRANVVGTIRAEADMVAYAAQVADGERQRAWWFGGFALVLADVEPVPFFAVRGALGLFSVAYPEPAQVLSFPDGERIDGGAT